MLVKTNEETNKQIKTKKSGEMENEMKVNGVIKWNTYQNHITNQRTIRIGRKHFKLEACKCCPDTRKPGPGLANFYFK